jgi:hypothetical protein
LRGKGKSRSKETGLLCSFHIKEIGSSVGYFFKEYKIKSVLSLHAQMGLKTFPALFKRKTNVKFLLASLKTLSN